MKKTLLTLLALCATALGGFTLCGAASTEYVRIVSDLKVDVVDSLKFPVTFYSSGGYYNGSTALRGLTVTAPDGYRLLGWYKLLAESSSGQPGPSDCTALISESATISQDEVSAAPTSAGWSIGGNPTHLVSPKFVKVWKVTATASPESGGTVTGAGTVDDGATVTLTAKPNVGFVFDSWQGLGETSATLTTAPITADANFVAVFRELKVDKPTVTTSFTYDGNAKTCATAGNHYTVSDNVKTAVGTYTFTATLKDGYHWSDGTSEPYTVEWTIGKAQNDFTEQPTITGWTYGSSASTPAAKARFSGTITYAYYDAGKNPLSGRPTDAGTYYLTATTPSSDNYTAVTSDFVSFSIAPREINTSNITYSDKTETYDGTAKTIVVGNVPDHVTATYSNNSRTDAGIQTATVTFAPENGNYTVSVKARTATLTIDQATVSSFVLEASSVTYDGQPHPPVVKSVTANGKTFTDADVGWSVSCNRDDFVNAGEIRVDVTGNNNLTGSAQQTFTIDRAKTADLSATPLSFTYNGQPQGPKLTLTHCAEDAASEHEKTEPGTYNVRATPDANHAWSNGSTSSRYISWTISYLKVTVSFDLNYEGASVPSSSELNYMKGYTLPTPSRAGYVFEGWWTAKEGGTVVTTSTKVERSDAHTLYAHWKAKEYTLMITMDKDVRYEGNESPYTLPATLVYDATNLNELAVVSKPGYRFRGYYLSNGTQLYDAEGHNVKDPLAQYWSDAYPNGVYRYDGNLTVEARFSEPIVEYEIGVSASPADAGTVTGGGIYEKGSNVVLTATANPGYSFARWTGDGGFASTDNPLKFTAAKDAAFTSVFTGNVYTVSLKGVESTSTKTVTFGEAYGEFQQYETPTKIVTGWYYTDDYDPADEVKADTKVNKVGDHKLYAKWEEKKEFTVTFVDPTGRNDPIPVPYPKDATVSAPPADTAKWSGNWDEEYWIAGWTPPLPQIVTEDLAITAVRESIATVLDCEEQGLVFRRNDNWKVCTDDHFAGNSCLKLGSVGGTDTVRTALPAGDGGLLTFYWKSDAGKELIVKVSQGGEDYSLPNFVARNTGWNQETIEIRAGGEATVVFTCSEQVFDNSPRLIDTVSWQPGAKPSRTVTVTCGEHGKLKQGSTGAFPYGSDVTLEAEADPGYAFCCWTNDTDFATNANPWTFTVVDDIAVKATFTNAQYAVTLDPNGGKGGDTAVIVTYLKPMPDLASLPTRTDGWTFNGYTNVAGFAYYDALGTSVKNWDQPNAAPLFAQWKAPDEYALTVSVIGRGAVDQDPPGAQHVANTQVKLTATPETGAVFAHWSDGDKNPERTVTMDRDITLTATFTNRQYVVTFDANGGSVSQKTKIVTYGETYGELPTPTQKGYDFVGWFTAASGGNEVEAMTTVTAVADHVLYAQWKKAVSELSKALDCDNLEFVATGGWTVFTNSAFAKEGISCLSNSVKGATLTTTVTEAGTLAFWWRGRGVDDFVRVKVSTNAVEIKSLELNVSADESSEDWEQRALDIEASVEKPVTVMFKANEGRYDGDMVLDFFTWVPATPAHPEPTDADRATITAAGMKDGKFTLSFTSDERFDYNLLTNANLLINSWGEMEKKAGTGKTVIFEPEIVDGLPQLFYKVETLQKKD